MKNYLDLLHRILNEGESHTDRTGVGTVRIFGAMLEFDLANGFPILQARKVPWRSAIGEMIAFARGANNVAEFEELGCKFWNANAEGWDNPAADGNYLGRIYGVQARRWKTGKGGGGMFDQLAVVLDELKYNPDSRRLLVTHWRPDEFHEMALPPCHVQYQFLCDKAKGELSLKFDMRSTDMVLGAPNNIVGYAWLLHTVASLTGYTPRKLIMTMGDCHIYKNHIAGVTEMLGRTIIDSPVTLRMRDDVMNDRDNVVKALCAMRPDMFELEGYTPHEVIKFEMAV